MPETNATILIGYDGSDDAELAIRAADHLLAPPRAIVAYVWSSLAELLLHTDVDKLTGTMAEAAEEVDQAGAEQGRSLAARGTELAAEAGFDATPVAVRGKPKAWPSLLELADHHDASAVVVGSRGLGGVRSALLGSVSSGVIAHAKLPVLVVPPLDEPDALGPILIAYDGSDYADAAIRAAGRLFSVREAVVQTAWVSYAAVSAAGVAGMSAGMVATAAAEIDRNLELGARRTAERGAELAALEGFEARAGAVRTNGNVWSALLGRASDVGAAAITVGSRGRSGFDATLLGSVSRALVHHARVPVLVV